VAWLPSLSLMSLICRPLIPPALLISSIAIWMPTSEYGVYAEAPPEVSVIMPNVISPLPPESPSASSPDPHAAASRRVHTPTAAAVARFLPTNTMSSRRSCQTAPDAPIESILKMIDLIAISQAIIPKHLSREIAVDVQQTRRSERTYDSKSRRHISHVPDYSERPSGSRLTRSMS
jgi:hypothetical protein